MKLIPALENEKNREAQDQWGKVYVHKEGMFFHIYDWSAWLVKTVVCTEEFQKQRGDAKMLAANRYNAKGNEYIMIGFPLESLSKYIVDYKDATPMEDGGLVIDLGEVFESANTYETILSAFEQWKASCPVKENKAKSKREVTNGDNNLPTLGRSGIFNILSQILSYPIEQKTPAENIEFISRIKQQLVELL